MNTEQIYKAWHAVGADIAGLKWDDFVKALEKQPAQQEPVVSKATYNRIRDEYNELLTASKRDAADAKSWRNHVVRCQFGQVDLDHVFTSPPPVPVLSAGPITPAMMKPFTQEERNELEQVLKTHMKPAPDIQRHNDYMAGFNEGYSRAEKNVTPQPTQRNPLTDERIREIADKKFSVYSRTYESYNFYKSDLVKFARAIEVAHGIKENT